MTSEAKLQFPEDLFWAKDPDFGRIVFRYVFRNQYKGLLLGAPADVDLRIRSQLPAYAFAVVDAHEAWDFRLEREAVLVACELTSFECKASLAIAPLEREVREQAPRPPSEDAGRVGGGARLDVRSRLNLPWAPGVWQLVLVARDWRSDPVRVVLRSDDAAPPAAAPLPGAKLALTASGQGLDTVLDVALKVHATRSALKSPGAGGEAAVPVTFVVNGHAQAIPYVARRAVPGHWGPAGEPEHVVAVTRVALKELVPAGVHDSALYVWAFAGDQMSDPVRVVTAPP